jgi:hypothetical protein
MDSYLGTSQKRRRLEEPGEASESADLAQGSEPRQRITRSSSSSTRNLLAGGDTDTLQKIICIVFRFLLPSPTIILQS